MIKTIFICDVCKKESDCIKVKEVVETEMDSSGNGYNDILEYNEICKDCLPEYLREHKGAKIY